MTPEQIDELIEFIEGLHKFKIAFAESTTHEPEQSKQHMEHARKFLSTIHALRQLKQLQEQSTYQGELRRAAEITDKWSKDMRDRPVWTVARDIKQTILNEANNQQGEEK